MFQKPNKKRVLYKRTLTTVVLGLFLIATIVYGGFVVRTPKVYAAGTNSTINFQARLQMKAGSIAPDGKYNVQFKIYDASTSGSLLWTETYYDSNGVTAGNDNRVQVKNGYLSVHLGSQTAFPSTINWDQDLYMTMNIGGTDQTATPTYDGEMDPRLKLTGVPYAFRAGQLAQYNATTGFTSTLSILQPTVGNQVFQLADQGAAGTYTLCIQNSTSCGFALATGGSGYIQNTTSPQTADFNITGTGTVSSLLTGNLDTVSAGTLAIGTSNATTINVGTNNADHTINIGTGTGIQTTTIGSQDSTSQTIIQGGGGAGAIQLRTPGNASIEMIQNNVATFSLDIQGRATFQPLSDDASTFKIMNAAGTKAIFNIDTSTNTVNTCSECSIFAGYGGIYTTGAITLDPAGNTTSFITPLGSSIATRINVPLYDPGEHNQIIAMGLPEDAADTARAITLLDARTSAHQPTIAVLSPDENNIGGFSWDGSNATFSIKTTTGSIGINHNGVNTATFDYASGVVTESLGVAGSITGQLLLANSSNSNTVILASGAATSSYTMNLPPDLGSENQCLNVAGVSGTTQTLGYADCLTSATGAQLQADTLGTAQAGNLNLDGTGIFGTGVTTPLIDSAADGTLSVGSTNATAINIGNSSSNITTTITGSTIIKPSTGNDSSTAFQIQNAAGASLMSVDSTTSSITLLGNNSATLSSWTSTTALSTGTDTNRVRGGAVAANGYLYQIGGVDGTGATVATVQYAKINANGSIGDWNSTTALNDGSSAPRRQFQPVVANGYLYIVGGRDNSGNFKDTTMYAKLNADGTVGSWHTTTALPESRFGQGTVVSNGYVYVIGGFNSGVTPQDTVYYAKLNADGTVGSWGTTTAMATTLTNINSTTAANGYIYIVGGYNSGTRNTIYYTKLNADGTVGNWTIQDSVMSDNDENVLTYVANGYLYALGGDYHANALAFPLNANGSVGTGVAVNAAPDSITGEASHAQYNGYFYILGGSSSSDGGGTVRNTVSYAGTSRVKIGGGLDLVGLTGENLADGQSGGQLTAGNTSIVGTLQVAGEASFLQGVNINNGLSINGSTSINTNSATALQIQSADGSTLFTANTNSKKIVIGDATNNITFNSDGGYTLNGNARNARSIDLYPEYAGAVLDSGGTGNNSGTMTTGVDLTTRTTYYKWTTSAGSNQTYDIVIQVPLPGDFAGWSAGGIYVKYYTSDTTNGTIKLETRDSNGSVDCNFDTITGAVSNSWQYNGNACPFSGGKTYSPGSSIYLRIRMQSPSGGDVRVGQIQMSYYSNR